MTPTTAPRATVIRSRPDQWRGAIAFEWTKLASVRSTWWALVAAAVTTAGGSWLLGASAKASALNGFDTAMPAPHLAFQAITVAQVAVVLLAALAITSEYANRSITTTLQSVPVRGRVLLAKAVVVGAFSGLVGVVLAGVGTAVAALSADHFGTFTASQMLDATVGTAVVLALLSVTVLGIGTALRSTAGTIITMLAILFALPLVLPVFTQGWMRGLVDYLPSEAAAVLVTRPGESYSATAAVGILAAWALGSLAVGHAVLRRRDT